MSSKVLERLASPKGKDQHRGVLQGRGSTPKKVKASFGTTKQMRKSSSTMKMHKKQQPATGNSIFATTTSDGLNNTDGHYSRVKSPAVTSFNSTKLGNNNHSRSGSNHEQAGSSGRAILTDDKVMIESLQAQIKALKARVAVTEDLEQQVATLENQLYAATRSKEELQRAMDEMAQQHS